MPALARRSLNKSQNSCRKSNACAYYAGSLVPSGAAGDWADKSGNLAIAQAAGGWIYAVPKDGRGFGLPDGRLFIKQTGVYKELKFDAKDKTGKLAELTDINNAAAALGRAILTKIAAEGKNAVPIFTFLPPQEAFAGVKVPVADVVGLDLSKLAHLEKPNTFLENNIFKSEISVTQTATFMSSVSAAALNVGGTATFAGALTANGDALFNKSISIANTAAAQFPYAYVNIQDHTKNGGGICLTPKSDANSKVEIAYLAGGGMRIFTPDGGDILTIDKSGALRIQGWGLRWGKDVDGWPAQVASDGNISGKIWKDYFGGNDDKAIVLWRGLSC